MNEKVFKPISFGLQLSYDEAVEAYMALTSHVSSLSNSPEEKQREETARRVVQKLFVNVSRRQDEWP